MRHSYSSYSTFKQCAAKWHYAYVEFKDAPRAPPGPAAERGTAVHDSIEFYMLQKQEQLHKDIHKAYGQYFMGLRSKYARVEPEKQWALSREWKKVPYKSERAWVRGFFDLVGQTPLELNVYEWKTGRVYDSHVDQRFLYGTVALILFPKYTTVTVTGKYFDQKGYQDGEVYERTRLSWMKQEWEKRLGQIEAEEYFAPNPTNLCKWCEFSTQNGGPCKF